MTFDKEDAKDICFVATNIIGWGAGATVVVLLLFKFGFWLFA